MEAGKVPRRSLQQTSVSDVPKSKKSTTAPLDIRAEGLPGASTEKRKMPAAKGRDGDEIRVYQAVDPAQSRASTSIEEPETKDSPKAEQNPQIGRDPSGDPGANLEADQSTETAEADQSDSDDEEDENEYGDDDEEDSDDSYYRYKYLPKNKERRIYRCWGCNQKCYGITDLYDHRDECYYCDDCHEDFYGRKELNKHRWKVHGVAKDTEDLDDSEDDSQ